MIHSLEAILDALGEAALLTDAELNLVALNSAAESLYEIRSKSILGRKLVDLIGTLVSDAQNEGWAVVLRGDVWRGVVWHQKPNRKKFRAELSVRALFDEHNAFSGMIAIVKDVTNNEAELIRQSILSRSLRAIGDAATTDDLYQVMLEALTTLNGADGAVFRIREPQGYRILAVAGVDINLLESIRIGSFVEEEPALLRGETVKINFAEAGTLSKYDLIKSLGFSEAHLVGQRVAGELIGSIALIYRQAPWVDLCPILPDVAAALGARLERERAKLRLERERTALEVLAQVSTAMRQVATKAELYTIATEFALKATRASSSFVLLSNPERSEMLPISGSGVNALEMLSLVLKRGSGLSWQVLDTGLARVEQRAAQLPEAYSFKKLTEGSNIGVPLVNGHLTVVGVLTADTQANQEPFSEADLDILTAISEALSSALTRLEALETAQQRADAFAKLAQLSSDLEQLEDEKAIAALGLATLLELTGLEGAIYFALNDQMLVPVAVLGTVSNEYLRFQTSKPLSEMDMFFRAMQSEHLTTLEDVATRVTPDSDQFYFRTILIAPVRFQGQVKAFLSAASLSKVVALPANTREIVDFIAGRLTRAIERADAIQEVLNTRAQTFRTLGLALEMRDFETKGHTDRVLALSLQLGQALNLNEQQLQALEWGALLHDIGKIAVPDHVLLKPAKLSPDEWLWIRQHPTIGFQMLQGLDFLPKDTLDIVLYHQERTDGSGYPECLTFHKIPFLARLFAVVDVFDALTSERPYKAAWSTEAAVFELQRQAGKTLDEKLVTAFLQILNIPVLA